MAITLIVVDDHPAVRLGVRNLLAGSGIEVVDEAASGAELVDKLAQRQPDVVLLDVRMTGGDGLHFLGRLKVSFPNLPVVLYSMFDNPTYVARAVALGASGYVLKSNPKSRLVEAIHTALRGELAWSREELRRVTGALATPRVASDIEVPLTHRENEVLEHLSTGLTNKEIAQSLGISYETVKEHVQHILRKIGVSDRTQAAIWAVRKGLV